MFSEPTTCKCYAALTPKGLIQPHTITRRACFPKDVVVDIKYAGICHSDIHQAREEWGSATFPMVPGHEIGGVVVAVGANVTQFKVGDVVGVGCMVDSCRECQYCKAGEEQYCSTDGAVFTYNSTYKYPHCVEHNGTGGACTYGGYSKSIVVDEAFVLRIPSNLDLAAATPLLCAGITTYSPIMHYGLKPHMKYAVVGLGGLGHMAVKFGVALGCNTTVVSRSASKKDSVLHAFKAHAFINASDPKEMEAAQGSFDFIINTIAAVHDIDQYVKLLKVDGKMILVGVPPDSIKVDFEPLVMKRRTIAGSLIGGIKETQEMLDFCGAHNIVCDIEMITPDQINEAYERINNAQVKYRVVIDMANA